MNLIYVFDNYYFNITNTFVIKNIKRWIIYELLNLINSNIYENIILIKTGPTICSCKLNLKKDNVIIRIIEIINSIIYKKYNTYPNINLKRIIDELNNYSDQNNKIIIFTAIYQPGLTQYNKEYLNKILKKFNSSVVFYNISKYKFLNLNFQNITEVFIDFRIKDISKLILPIIFSIDEIDFSDELKKETEIILVQNIYNYLELLEFINYEFLQNDKSIQIDENDQRNQLNYKFIFYYILLSNKLERILIKKINYDDLENIMLKFLNIDLDSFEINKEIIILLKNFKNVIENIFNRNKDICPIIIPTNQLNEESLNVIYILEFYKEIYSKFINYHIDSNKKNFKILNVKTTEILMKNLKLINKINTNDILDNSKLYMMSNITLSNWLDEFNEFNPFGILIKYDISKFAYKGLIDEYSSIIYNYPEMIINSVSNNWVSLYDYYQMILADVNYENDEECIKKNHQFNLNEFIIIDNLNGDSNVMLPIYINKNHWRLVKNVWSYHMTFINNSFEYQYNKKMDNIYYLVLLKCFNNLNDNTKSNNNLFRLFICILRTCAQINIDNKYINSVKNEKDKYFNKIVNFIKIESDNKYFKFKHVFIDYLIRTIQLIVSFNSDILTLKKELVYIRNIKISMFIEYNFSSDYWKNINNIFNDDKENEILIFKNKCIENNISWFNLENDIISLCEFVNLIYKIKNFNQFLKYVDSVNGCIPVDIEGLINCEIIKNIYNKLENNKEFNIDFYLKEIDFNNLIPIDN